MEPKGIQQLSTETKNKLNQTIEKNSSLLNQEKHYQFAQKIKLLAHRKTQTKKYEEGEYLLLKALQKMASYNVKDIVSFELIELLGYIYINNENIWTYTAKKQFFRVISLYPDTLPVIKLCEKLARKLSKIEQSLPYSQKISKYYEKENKFLNAQKYAVLLNQDYAHSFLSKWKQLLSQTQWQAVQCRFALIKYIYDKQEEAKAILENVQGCIYKNFAKFLIASVQSKSKKVFEKVGDQYSFLLQDDATYNKVYSVFGIAFFSLQSKQTQNNLFSALLD